MSALVGNPEDRFRRDVAHVITSAQQVTTVRENKTVSEQKDDTVSFG